MSLFSKNESRALQERVRLGNPLQRMRSERRVALIVFNVLLLAAALMQLLGYGIPIAHEEMPVQPPLTVMESYE
jgi:hypothetical protein